VLLHGIKYGVVAVLINIAFLPLAIAIGDYFGRIDIVGHYSGPLPVSWIIGLSIAIVIPFAIPFIVAGSVLGIVIFLSHKINFLRNVHGIVDGAFLGLLAAVWGLGTFEIQQLEALGTWVFICIMTIWGMVLFAWIGFKMQQRMNS
jgi:hypothetical protein